MKSLDPVRVIFIDTAAVARAAPVGHCHTCLLSLGCVWDPFPLSREGVSNAMCPAAYGSELVRSGSGVV